MRRQEERGQATVELALVLPVLVLILFGIMEFGRLFSAYLVVTNAAREGARLAAVGADDAAIVARVRDAAGSLDPAALTVDIEPPASNRFSGTEARVTVSYAVYLVTPVLTGIAPNPFPLRARAVMRVE